LKDLCKVRYLDEEKDFLVKSRFVGSIKTAFNVAGRHAGIEGFDFHDFSHMAVTYMDGQLLISHHNDHHRTQDNGGL
jgi:hypothetical protein